MRKNILWVLIFVSAFLFNNEPAFASSASIELKNDGTAVVGDEFDITMEVDSEESLSGIETYIFYDDDKAEFLSADDGIAGGKGVLRVNIRSFEDIKGKLRYKMKFLARKAGSFTISFSDEVHLYAIDTDDEISVAAGDLEMRIKNKREASSDSSLSNLKVAGAKLKPQFSKSVLDYTVNVGSDVDDITIGIEPSDGNSSYSYRFGDGDKLHEGENKRTIIVTAEDGSTTTYTLTIIKASEPEVTEATKAGVEAKAELSSEIASKSAISEAPEYVPDPPPDGNQTETDIKDSKEPVIYVIIGAVVILGFMLILGIVLYIKSKKNENED